MVLNIIRESAINVNRTETPGNDPFRKVQQWESFLSGFHTFDNKMSEDAADWRNVAFARYYGIAGIRMGHLEDVAPESNVR